MWNINWAFFFTAMGLAFVLEGAVYMLFAERMPRILALMAAQSPLALRGMGVVGVALGLAIIALCRLG